MRPIVFCVVLLLFANPALASHPKTDVVRVEDGTHYIGEIKGIEAARVSLKTNAAGTLSIEWRYVTGIQSEYEYRIELSGGVLLYGSLAFADDPADLRIATADGSVEVRLVDVVTILPVEKTLSGRLDGSVSLGITYTRANRALQYNLTLDATYRSRKNIVSFTGQSIFNTQAEGATTSQQYSNLQVSQVIGKGWGTFELGQLQSNPDQGFDVRLILGGGGTYLFKERALQLISASLGVVYNREDVTGEGGGVDETAELLVAGGYRQFKHSSHSPRIRIQLNTFTDVTEERFRFNLTSEVSWKIIGDLTFDLQFNDYFDSRPPGEDALRNDFSVVTSVGYTF